MSRPLTRNKLARLDDRGVVAVTGANAENLLQGLITNDMALLGSESAIFAGLLTPQGKILFDFFVAPTEGGYLLETARDKTADLVKRLTMYKLRAEVALRDVSEDYPVYALWGRAIHSLGGMVLAVSYPDPRRNRLGMRILLDRSFVDLIETGTDAQVAAPGDYHAHRIALGVPEGGKDYVLGDTFPHEALFDELHGVSFTKGCYVGQEVVSRMQHRASTRKRVARVRGAEELPATGTPVMAGSVALGALGSTAGREGLALLRLDRVAEFAAQGVGLTAAGSPLEIVAP